MMGGGVKQRIASTIAGLSSLSIVSLALERRLLGLDPRALGPSQPSPRLPVDPRPLDPSLTGSLPR